MFARIIKIAPPRDGSRAYQKEGNGNWVNFAGTRKAE
jgi:hypothetical protein